tara:strand:- start:193 stop:681 length:489 start_codon:yes stop_codon:yes gene_type:complete
MKKCTKCKKELPLSSFWKQKTTKSGYRSQCKNCLGFKGKSQWGVVKEIPKEVRAQHQRDWKSRQPAGIYKITCSANKRVYIGETKCLRSRWTSHKSDLNRPKGKTNSLLQEDWNKFGESAFTFEVLEEAEKDKAFLYERELFYIRKFHGEGCELYNKERLEE